jgi:PEP-CTERM motif
LTLPRTLRGSVVLLAVMAATHPAEALLIVPTFTGAITASPNEASIESAIDSAIGTIDSLYANPGSVNIVFDAGSGNFLGQSETVDYGFSYSAYTSQLAANSAAQPSNTVLASAIANLASGNQLGPGGTVLVTGADARTVLGANVTGCFNASGTFVNTCGQTYDGVITLNTSLSLNYTTTPLAGAYSAIATMEHEIDEILGGGGQGSMLNRIPCGGSKSSYPNVGALDLYRYSSAGTPSFSSCNGTSAYLSVDGGATPIVAFNADPSGDLADFGPAGDVQSADATPGIVPSYTTASPEFSMMESIGYDGPTNAPEPMSLALLGSGLAGMLAVRRRCPGTKFQ